MSEKGKEIERVVVEKEIKKGKMSEMEGDEREMIDHWSHEHPLSLVDTRGGEYCYGCEVRFGSGEKKAYGCSMEGCEYANLLHEECAAMAREIRHPLHHPHHILIQQHQPKIHSCDICKQRILSIVYRCSFRGNGDELMLNFDIIQHSSHPNHELELLQRRSTFECNACDTIHTGIWFVCTTDGCGYRIHQICASLPQIIKRGDHLHPLSLSFAQQEIPDPYIDISVYYIQSCKICSRSLHKYKGWIYYCRTCIDFKVHITCAFNEPQGLVQCGFKMHLRCAQGGGVVEAEDQRRSTIHHLSHPGHELKLLRRRCSFKCDACCTTRKEPSSYICTNHDCQYWIHESCASLPPSFKREDHHHSLSLSFEIPFEYFNFNFKCDVCNTSLLPNYWIYHCLICRFIVHVKCAFNKPPPRITLNIGRDIIRLPTNEVAEELITPFVMREKGAFTPNDDGDELVKVKYYKFIHHQHQLTLLSSGDRSQQQEEEDEENYGVRSELICDACITPISSSSSNYYMSCSECKYNLHLACFHLPPQLSSLPLHQRDDHQLVLRSSDKHQPWKYQYCSVCGYRTNGLFYTCTACRFKVDIKCACMPDTILHAAHPQHLLNHVAWVDLREDINSSRLSCAAGCGEDTDYYHCYRCCSSSSCDFIVHVKCAVLPASVISRRWDRQHPLLLTYDATLNRPGDFYCDQCETQMNPRRWMYHCRSCDLSFHSYCFPTTSSWFRNMKLGQEYDVNAETHPHPLTFQLLTTKRRCDICRYNENENQGFYCALCNFFICLYNCGKNMIQNGDMKAVD